MLCTQDIIDKKNCSDILMCQVLKKDTEISNRFLLSIPVVQNHSRAGRRKIKLISALGCWTYPKCTHKMWPLF